MRDEKDQGIVSSAIVIIVVVMIVFALTACTTTTNYNIDQSTNVVEYESRREIVVRDCVNPYQKKNLPCKTR